MLKRCFDYTEHISFENQLKDFIESECHDYYDTMIIESRHDYITKIDNIFLEFLNFYKNHEKFSLSWVLRYTQNEVDKLFKEVVVVQRDKLHQLKVEGEIGEYVKSLKKFNKIRLRRMRRRLQIFSIILYTVSFLDVILPVFLILLISRLTHFFDEVAGSLYFGSILVLLITLAKVLIDRYFIVPKLEKWGWKMYLISINRIQFILSRVIGLSMIIRTAIKNNENPEKVVRLINDIMNKLRKGGRICGDKV